MCIRDSMKYHAKSGASSLKIERVMLNLVFGRFCRFCAFLPFLHFYVFAFYVIPGCRPIIQDPLIFAIFCHKNKVIPQTLTFPTGLVLTRCIEIQQSVISSFWNFNKSGIGCFIPTNDRL